MTNTGSRPPLASVAIGIALAWLLALMPATLNQQADRPTEQRIRAAIRQALAQVDRTPADLRVRDIRMWQKNQQRFRDLGKLVGDYPLPSFRDPLRAPLIDQSLRTPMAALRLGLDLYAGLTPPTLTALLTGAPNLRPPAPRPLDRSGIPDSPAWVAQLISLMLELDSAAASLSNEKASRVEMQHWMLQGFERDQLDRAREVFDAYASKDPESLLDRVLALVDLARQQDGSHWPTLSTPLSFSVQGHRVILGTTGPDRYETDAWLLIDPGGDDTYLNNAGGVADNDSLAVLIDLGGNDSYRSNQPFTQGSAYHGVGILLDTSGNDSYLCADFCQSAAVGGLAALVDLDGTDRMDAAQFAQGAAAFGIALLDAAGGADDSYTLDAYGQGFSRTAGIALMHDRGGADAYRTRERIESPYSQWTNGRPVYWSFSQGASSGFFQRYHEPLQDGDEGLVIREMFPGGIGLLMDEEGDDSYLGSMYSQGAAYFYGLGLLLDRAGSDSYTAGWYGQGAAAHYAVGILVDGAGDDQYRGINQVQGSGRDFSSGLLLDLAGADDYRGEDRVQGCGDKNDAYGILVDLEGADQYHTEAETGRGYATNQNPEDQPRRKRPYADIGLFLDLNGLDDYHGTAQGANRSVWIERKTKRGIGLDAPLPDSRAPANPKADSPNQSLKAQNNQAATEK